MSILAPPAPRPITTTYLQGQTIQPGGSSAVHVLHSARGSRLGVAVRCEDAASLNIGVEPYSALPGGYRIGPAEIVVRMSNDVAAVGTYVVASPAVRIIVVNTGSTPVQVRGLVVTDYPEGPASDPAAIRLADSVEAGIVAEGRVAGTTYSHTSRLPGTAVGDYQIRDTVHHFFSFPVVDPAVFDHSIWIVSTLDEPVRVIAHPQFRSPAGSLVSGPTFFQGTDALTIIPGGRLCLCPEVPRGTALTEGNRIVYGDFTMAELSIMREPVMDALMVRVYAANEAPTEGEIYLRHIVRK